MTDQPHQQTYVEITSEQAAPLIKTPLTIESMERSMAQIMRVQSTLDRLPVLNRINLLGLMQNLTPASIQRKVAAKKAVQTAQFLGEHNRACIAFWREHGITDLGFLDPNDADSLRKLPIMTPDYFFTYSPKDRFYGPDTDTVLLSSSGTFGRPKLFLSDQADNVRLMPVMKLFLKNNWEIDRYKRVEIVVSIPEPEAGKPQWGACYNMMQLLSMIAQEMPQINYAHLSDPTQAVAHIQEVLDTTQSRTLVVIYSYPPDALSIIRELTDLGRSFERSPNVDFKFTFTGEAIPPYKLFQIAAWLKLIDPELVNHRVAEVLSQAEKRQQLNTLVRTFSIGLGAAELATGASGSPGTALWNLVMYLLSRNEPERVAPFLARHFDGQDFPWTAIKSSPNIFFLIGREGAQGNATLEPPEPGKHSGPGFATSLPGQVVNCQLDYMHIWDMHELADLLLKETGLDIQDVARSVGIKYDSGDMLMTNGRMDNAGAGGLDAAVSWRTLRIYGHDLQAMVASLPDLSGMFSAQNVDYGDGSRTLWIHLEADKGQNPEQLQKTLAQRALSVLDSMNPEFRYLKEVMLELGGQERLEQEVQVRVLPYGHPRFQRQPGQVKHKYIYKPQPVDGQISPDEDPVAKGIIE